MYTLSLAMSGTYEKIILAPLKGQEIFILDLNRLSLGWSTKASGKKPFGVHGKVINTAQGKHKPITNQVI